MSLSRRDLDGHLEFAAQAFYRDRVESGAAPERARYDALAAVSDTLRTPPIGPGAPHTFGFEVGALDSRALYGLPGRFVRLFEPHTESDPAALLVQLLAGCGSILGRSAHVRIGADLHFGNLFTLLVGLTATGRKGTSGRLVQYTLTLVDPLWSKQCIQHGGLATGEGLVCSVRDAQGNDPGVEDKRLLVMDGEFAAVLKVAAREGNTLSPMIRNGWDTGNLANVNKTSPCRATGAHISLQSHITRDELLRRLDKADLAGGFMNRFLIVCVKRSKLLPFGGEPPEHELRELVTDLKAALEFGKERGEYLMDLEANNLWKQAYPFLSRDRSGAFGAATARAEAQVIRIALLYAVLDRATEIRRVHLEAALAVWDFCEASALSVFGELSGDRPSDEVLAHLRRQEDWITRTDLVDAFGRHLSGARLSGILDRLRMANLVSRREVETKGRPREEFRARKARKASVLELCSHSSQPEGVARPSSVGEPPSPSPEPEPYYGVFSCAEGS